MKKVSFQLEISGDPPSFENSQGLSYFSCAYFLIVSITTVGYGDIFCVTVTGRMAMILFLMLGPVSRNVSEILLDRIEAL